MNKMVENLVQTISKGICKDLEEAKQENFLFDLDIDISEYVNAFNALNASEGVKLIDIWNNDDLTKIMKKHDDFNIRQLSLLYRQIENSKGELSTFFIYNENSFTFDDNVLISIKMLIYMLCEDMDKIVRFIIANPKNHNKYKNLYAYYIAPLFT